jgi:hypothetical protein
VIGALHAHVESLQSTTATGGQRYIFSAKQTERGIVNHHTKTISQKNKISQSKQSKTGGKKGGKKGVLRRG